MTTFSEYQRKMREAREYARAKARGDFDDVDEDVLDESPLNAVKPRPCSVCGVPCRDITAQPKCRDCGPTNPDRWNR